MKYFFFFLLFLASANSSHAQNTTADSLTRTLTKTMEDSNRVFVLVKLSRAYLYSKPELSLQYAQTGLNLSRKIQFVKGKAMSLRMMGNVFYLTGNYPKSLETLLQALKLDESINNLDELINCNVGIGNNYNFQGEYPKSIFYYQNAKSIAEITQDTSSLVTILLNVGDSYEKSNLLDSARINTEKAYELIRHMEMPEYEGIALSNLGNIYSKMGKDDIAMEYYRRSLPFEDSSKNYHVLSETMMGMARLFKKAGNADSTLLYARQSIFVSQRSGFTRRILDASIFLSEYYDQNKNIDSAYAYQKITLIAKDSLFSQEKERALRNLSFAEQTRQQEIENAASEAIELRRKNIQMAAIGVFIPLFLGFILLLNRRKAKPKAVGFMGLFGLLFLFEFIALLIHPYIEEWTHSTPILMLLILVAVASILVPLHHRLEHWVKSKLIHNHHSNHRS